MCRSQCAVCVRIADGKIVGITADTDSPRGRLCVRGSLAQSVIYSKDRLLEPLIRVGERGEGTFRKASWDEALDAAAAGFREIIQTDGPQAIAGYFGQGVLEKTIESAGAELFREIGSPNEMNCGSICNTVSSLIAPVTTFGMPKSCIKADIDSSDAVFVWGKNPATDDGPGRTMQKIKAAKQRGAKLVVIDPRRSRIGEMADIWAPVTPGSDGALSLALLKKLTESGKYDRTFAEQYVYGFDSLCRYLKGLSMQELLSLCGIPEELFEQVFEIFCISEKVTLVSYTGLEYQRSGVQNSRAMWILWALGGKIDVKGGMLLDTKPRETLRPCLSGRTPLPIGAEKFPLFTAFTGKGQFSCFPEAVIDEKPYKVSGLLISGGSPIVTYPDSARWKKAYRSLRYLAVLDRFMTEDAKFADVVFPVTTWYENASVLKTGGEYFLREPFIEPLGSCRNDIFIMKEIAVRLGKGDLLPGNNHELQLFALGGDAELLKRLQRGEKVTDGTKVEVHNQKYRDGLLRKDGKPGFPTMSGKFEAESLILETFGYEGLPVYHDVKEKINTGRFPLILTTGTRKEVCIGSFGQNIPEMAEYDPYPSAEISMQDAGRFGIEDGDTVKVTTMFGSVALKAKVCGMAEGAVHIPFGGGSSFMNDEWKNCNVNDLCSLDYYDPISGFVMIKSVPCRIEKQG